MEIKLIEDIVKAKREFFFKGNTKDLKTRIKRVKQIRDNLVLYKNEFYDAFKADFNKSSFEVATTELGQVIKECDFLIKNGKELIKPPVLLLFPIYLFLYFIILSIPLLFRLKGLFGTVKKLYFLDLSTI